MDYYFLSKERPYFRYSDDILIFADSKRELKEQEDLILNFLEKNHLTPNENKRYLSEPGESFDFLGFKFLGGAVDLSNATIEKIKGKIRRKARALRRWAGEKGISYEYGAIGFVRAMNRKFFSNDESGFCWSRWFFPIISTDEGLRKIDKYMQDYIRYIITGRHYKGNYRISYEKIKELGYISLVHIWYSNRDWYYR